MLRNDNLQILDSQFLKISGKFEKCVRYNAKKGKNVGV